MIRGLLQNQIGIFFSPVKGLTVIHDENIFVGGRSIPVDYVRNGKARRYIMRFRSDGSLRVTVPRLGSLRRARLFVSGNTVWINRYAAKLQTRKSPDRLWCEGTSVLYRGQSLPLGLVDDPCGGVMIRLAENNIPLGRRELPQDLRPVVEAYLKEIATDELPAQLTRLARELGVRFARVTIRGQRTRWGSCSTRKTVSLNWRLIHTPPFVQEYILIHELMHLREMNHSSRFWQHVQRACPGYRDAEKWLRDNKILQML